MALLLQTLGVMPALYSRWMNKSTQPAYILRVSGVQQLAALQDVFGSKHRARIEATLAGYQRHIRPHGYRQHDAYAVLTVRDVAHEEVDTTVYSMETSTGTLVASSGLICHNCFPKDVKALSYMAAEAGCHPQLLHAVMDINRDMRRRFVHRLSDLIGDLHGKRIGVWGLAFKQDTDDIRESPAIDIIRMLQQRGAVVSAYDPAAADNARRELPSVEYVDSPYAAAEGADAVLLITPWNEFKQVDLARVREVMRAPVLLDGRNIYDPEDVRRQGFVYVGIGR
ncbi:MAG: UDP-glucose/GDP-mannose dehydrogenase family protein [Thermomicrobiaceae bacterium]|nr:UDP-glucose/GDP-mannose dehydrogenase family protein [Thermomicrobiaceae bacterium]